MVRCLLGFGAKVCVGLLPVSLAFAQATEPKSPKPEAEMLLDLDLLKDTDLGRDRDLLRRLPVLERLGVLERLRLLESEAPVTPVRKEGR